MHTTEPLIAELCNAYGCDEAGHHRHGGENKELPRRNLEADKKSADERAGNRSEAPNPQCPTHAAGTTRGRIQQAGSRVVTELGAENAKPGECHRRSHGVKRESGNPDRG